MKIFELQHKMFYSFTFLVCISIGTILCSPFSKSRYKKDIGQKSPQLIIIAVEQFLKNQFVAIHYEIIVVLINKLVRICFFELNFFQFQKYSYSIAHQNTEDSTKAFQEAVKNGKM